VRTCPSCRRENADDSRYCSACGSPLGSRCGECGAELPADAEFCSTCGAPVPARAHLAGEERKVVTVLFADLVESTAQAERLDPEDLRGLQSPYFSRVRTELERFGGTVEKFIGDAVVAIFGAPVAHEDDPERAVRAAFAIRNAIPELNADSADLELHVRIAVNTGEAVVDLDASPGEGEGMVSGDVVNTCARLQTAAPVDGILVGETTYRATTGEIEYRQIEPVRAKGKRDLVPAWQAVELSPDGDSRPSTPLVGRTQELSHLLDAHVRVCKERTPQLVSLVGVPGIGKTRLVRELVQAIESEPELGGWLAGRCLSYGDGVSFAALAEMARSEAGIRTSDSAQEAAAKLRAAVEALPGELDTAWLEAHLRPLVGLEGEATERREESFAAWRRFFEAVAEREPLVLVFEDLHWADPGVLDFVDHLVDWSSGVPLLVLCTARPELLERRPDWGGGKRNAITISLSPLSDEDTGELVGALLGEAELPAPVAGSVLAHTAGNPLYAEEYARMLIERGYLVHEDGGWRLTEPELGMPETVQGTIAARIDALPPSEKALLQEAAVVGRVFWLGAVASPAELDHAEAERLLHALERKEFVRRDRRTAIDGEQQYVFRHVLVRDVAYGQIPRSRRTGAHLRAASWIESLPGAGEDQVEQLAHHYYCTLELAAAVGDDTTSLVARSTPALHRAGERALSLNAFDAAVRFFSAEVELLPADAPERPYALLGLGRAKGHAEGHGVEELEEAFEGLLAAGDAEAGADVASVLGPLLWGRSEPQRAEEYVRRAEELIEDRPPSRAKALVLSRLASLHSVRDDSQQAITAATAALEMAEGLGADEVRVRALAALGNARTQGGDWAGLDDFERSLAIATELRTTDAVLGCINYAGARIAFGDLTGAFELQARGRALAAEFGERRMGSWLRAERVYEHYCEGSWDDAVALANEVIRAAAWGSTSYMEILARLIRGHIRLDRGDLSGAHNDSERGLARALGIGDFQVVVPTQAFRARVLDADGRPDEARVLLLDALALLPGKEVWASYAWADLAVVLASLGLDLPEADATSRWLDAARAVVDGEPATAADRYAEIGSRPDEASSRLIAAEQLVAAGRRSDAEVQLEPALAFYREVDASARMAEAEATVVSA